MDWSDSGLKVILPQGSTNSLKTGEKWHWHERLRLKGKKVVISEGMWIKMRQDERDSGKVFRLGGNMRESLFLTRKTIITILIHYSVCGSLIWQLIHLYIHTHTHTHTHTQLGHVNLCSVNMQTHVRTCTLTSPLLSHNSVLSDLNAAIPVGASRPLPEDL